ncbi:MAG: glycosyltransferase family 4 protein [Eubacteriales bacterium]|nr:glycosyltransferase family 4 protein [Eubacteriales bacterium]
MKRVILLRSTPVNPDPPVEKMAATLVENGYKVTIVGWDREENYRMNKEVIGDTDHQITFVRLGIKACYGGGIKKNLLPIIRFQCRLYNWLAKNKEEYDIIHAFDFDTGLVASRCAKQFRKKLIYHVLDYYVDSHGLDNTSLEKPIRRLENSVINFADSTIICTEKRKEQIQGSNPKKLFIIHNTPKEGILDSTFKIQNGAMNSKKMKIAYVGVLDGGRALLELAEIVSKNEMLELHIGGFGPLSDRIEELSNSNDNIFYYGKLPYPCTLALESQCDVMVAIYNPKVPNNKYAAPNKFYESIMLGKPIIMAQNTGFDEIILQHDLGVCIDYSIAGLNIGVDEMIKRRQNWEKMGRKGRSLYKELYSWDVMEQRIINMYQTI